MNTTTRRQFLAASAVAVASPLLTAADAAMPLTLIVLDPLAKELSCPCVAGYAQRDYKELGKFLAAKLSRSVTVDFAETLEGALTKKTAGKADVVIGKDSVVQSQAKAQKMTATRLASLTDLKGVTTQEGWLVVHSSATVVSADQLTGYRMLFGPEEAEEKNAAPKALLRDLNVTYTTEPKDAASCTDCATKLLDHAKAGEKVCGVVSSYAAPLLEGCGTVKKGDLKVVGKTDSVPFIAAFAMGTVPADVQEKVKAALLAVSADANLCKLLETKSGFVEPPKKK